MKTLHVAYAKDDGKIFDLTSIFAEDDTRKWTFKTHAQLQAEMKAPAFGVHVHDGLASARPRPDGVGEVGPRFVGSDCLFFAVVRRFDV